MGKEMVRALCEQPPEAGHQCLRPAIPLPATRSTARTRLEGAAHPDQQELLGPGHDQEDEHAPRG